MNYDMTNIAASYDRGRGLDKSVIKLWMETLSSYAPGRCNTILDLGCGTGRFSESLAAYFDAKVMGIDPSEKMLAQARTKRADDRVCFELGKGESIPLTDNSVDLVFMSMIFHHLDDPVRTVCECRRVLRDGGTVFVRTGTRELIPSYAYVDFFPASVPLLHERLPDQGFICKTFENAGFNTITSEIVMQEIAPSYAAYAEKLAAGADSILVDLTRSEFESGMNALLAHAKQAGNCKVTERIDLLVFR